MTSPEPTLSELLEAWQQWSYRNMLATAAAKAQARGDAEAAGVLRAGAEREPVVEPLAALAANHRVSSLLRGWQWHAIRAAREQGASWQQVAAALETTPERARADFLDHIERAERYGGGLTDTASYRAVLDDGVGSDRPVSIGPARGSAVDARPSAVPTPARPDRAARTSLTRFSLPQAVAWSGIVVCGLRPVGCRRRRRCS